MKTAYINGCVYTGELPLVEAFIVEDSKFLYSGTVEDVLARSWKVDKVVDLAGSFVCCGFNDSHMHLLSYGNTLHSAHLFEHTSSLSDMISYLKKYLKDNPVASGQWLCGRGWNQDYFSDEQRMPTRWDLDKVSSDIPICVTRACGHCLVVNSVVIQLLNLTDVITQPDGGTIGLSNGIPNGLFFDNAMDIVNSRIPAPTKEDIKEMILSACHALNQYGITSCQTDDYCFSHNVAWQTINEAYQELENDSLLTVRVYEQCNFSNIKELQFFVGSGNFTGKGSELFRIGPLKMLGDGALGARTAFLSHPYADDPSTRGLSIYSKESMDDMIEYAHNNNMQIAVHAIGDACLDQVLHSIGKALAQKPKVNHRHGIVHCQISRPDQLHKIADLNLHVYAQSIFLDYDTKIVRSRVGNELSDSSYSWKTLMENGVIVSNGSDCPVELPNVFAGLECAVTRQPIHSDVEPYLPSQSFTIQEAVDSFTKYPPYASFEEKTKGRLEPGMFADFVILDKNPFQIDSHELHHIRVLGTFLGGQIVFPISSNETT